MKNYHYILGLDKSASIADIKTAYRKLSKKFHPDLNEGDKFFEDRFKEINEAYEYLIKNHAKQSYTQDSQKSKSGELPKIIFFKSDKSEIFNQGKIEVSWSIINADRVFIDLIGNVQSSGSSSVTINSKDDHFLLNITAENQYGKVNDQIKISLKKKTAFYKQKKYRIYFITIFFLFLALPPIFIYSSYIKMEEDTTRKEMELELLYQDLIANEIIPEGITLRYFQQNLKQPELREDFFNEMKELKIFDETIDLETFTSRIGLTPKPKGFWQKVSAATEYSFERLKTYGNSVSEKKDAPLVIMTKSENSNSINKMLPKTNIKSAVKFIYSELFSVIKVNSDSSSICRVDVNLLNQYYPSPFEEPKEYLVFSIDFLKAEEIIFKGTKYAFIFFKSVPVDLDQNNNWQLRECQACPGWMTIVRLRETIDGFVLDELLYDCACGSNSQGGKINIPSLHNIGNSYLILDSRESYYHMGISGESFQVCNALDLKTSLYLTQGGELDTTFTHKYETIEYKILKNTPTLYLEKVDGKMDYLELNELF